MIIQVKNLANKVEASFPTREEVVATKGLLEPSPTSTIGFPVEIHNKTSTDIHLNSPMTRFLNLKLLI